MNPNFNFNTFNATQPNLVQCLIEDEQIQEVDFLNNTRGVIGVTKAMYNELVEENDKHLELLYEHGILERPKTAEEIQNELMDQNKEMQKQSQEMIALMKEMRSEMNALKKENSKLKKEVKINERKCDNAGTEPVLSE